MFSMFIISEEISIEGLSATVYYSSGNVLRRFTSNKREIRCDSSWFQYKYGIT